MMPFDDGWGGLRALLAMTGRCVGECERGWVRWCVVAACGECSCSGSSGPGSGLELVGAVELVGSMVPLEVPQ